jgi:hypothetical protein
MSCNANAAIKVAFGSAICGLGVSVIYSDCFKISFVSLLIASKLKKTPSSSINSSSESLSS